MGAALIRRPAVHTVTAPELLQNRRFGAETGGSTPFCRSYVAVKGRMRLAPERGSRRIRAPELLQNRRFGARNGARATVLQELRPRAGVACSPRDRGLTHAKHPRNAALVH